MRAGAKYTRRARLGDHAKRGMQRKLRVPHEIFRDRSILITEHVVGVTRKSHIV